MTIQERVHSLAQPLAASLGLDVVEVEWTREHGRRILRVTIYKPAGISHDDCEALSRRLDAALDEAGAIQEPYHLEVSSPGAERPLESDEDYRRFAGRRVLIKLREPVAGRREWRGSLVGATPDEVVVAHEGGEMALPRGSISRARLSID
ncbi:MAG: ribosome maturation factor RimP [Candidatus Sericytochromatia bacterium]|nr:ribosome maturation factor RimP [Candidatus Tanganyikabacteria bacterium]